jgi:N-methylhydantoinase B
MSTGGGGGYGDPRRRATELVLRDLTRGLVSLESARDDYGVMIDAHGNARRE